MSDDSPKIGLIGGAEKREVTIEAYKAGWPVKFRKHADIIRRELESNWLQIEHIGSTSVPSLGAKPIVDILLVVENSGDESSYLPKLQKAGYELRVREPE